MGPTGLMVMRQLGAHDVPSNLYPGEMTVEPSLLCVSRYKGNKDSKTEQTNMGENHREKESYWNGCVLAEQGDGVPVV